MKWVNNSPWGSIHQHHHANIPGISKKEEPVNLIVLHIILTHAQKVKASMAIVIVVHRGGGTHVVYFWSVDRNSSNLNSHLWE